MSNIFSLKRFWKYFTFDLIQAKNNFGLSLLILGFMPLICYLTALFFKLIFEGTTTMDTTALTVVAYFVAVIATVLIFPRKTYGHLTAKGEGSRWIMLPASVEEKFLSMLLISCVILPVLLIGLLLLSDGLIGMFVPSHEPLWTQGEKIVAEVEDAGIHFNQTAIGFLNWVENILIFLLGAVCFKRGKVGKTFLCLFGVMTFLMLLSSVIFSGNWDVSDYFYGDMAPEKAERILNWVLNILYFVVIGGLLGGLYARLKTIKH